MLKAGDKIKFIQDFPPKYKKGDVVTIKMHNSGKGLFIPWLDDGKEGNWVSTNEHYFKKINKELITETDFLDAFQENFKEGV